MKMKKFLIGVILIIAVGAIAIYLTYTSQKQTALAEFHDHANFAVYLNGAKYNFNQSQYMTTEDNEVGKRQYVHMHDMNGGVIHLHEPGITLGMFFDSIGIKLNSTCFILDNGTSYCNSDKSTLKMFVNGVQSSDFDNLQLHDLNKVLISYGNDSSQTLQTQMSTVPTDACIYSNKCSAPPGFVNNESLTCQVGKASICSAK